MSGSSRCLSVILFLLAAILIGPGVTQAAYCPFCSAVGQTISEKIDAADVVVMAVLKNQPKQDLFAEGDELPKGTFEIKQVIRGDKYIGVGEKIDALLVGRYELETAFLIIGVDAPTIAWSTPLKMTEKSVKYVNDVLMLPKSGGKRLTFFQDYLQDEESMLAFDAYDEFARAPYADLIEMKDDMKHDELIKWIQDPEIPVNRKRLYYTMLGVCATEMDLQLFEDILKSGDRKRQRGLDSLIACYLNIKGKDGLALIDEHFLKNKEAEYVDVFAVISALRFHGSETDKIKREDLVKSMRHVLDRPKMADMVIPDLARWEDWSVVDKLVKMYETPPEESSSFIRVPIVTYLLACPNPEAKKHIEKLRKIDANAVLRAEKMLQWEMGLDDFGDDDDDDTESQDDQIEQKSGDKSGNDQSGKDQSGKDQSGKDQSGKDKSSAGGKKKADKNGDRLQNNVSDDSESNDFSDSTPTPGGVGTVAFQENPFGDFESDSTVDVEPGKSSQPAANSAGEVNPSSPADLTAKKGDSGSKKKPLVVTVPGDQDSESFVSTPGKPNADANSTSDKNVENIPDQPVASQSNWQGTMTVIMVPMTVCILLFLLSWSVINGWFERLIY